MAKVISRDSVRKANDTLISGTSHRVNMNSQNVSVRCKTSVNCGEMTFSRERIVSEANKAFSKSMK